MSIALAVIVPAALLVLAGSMVRLAIRRDPQGYRPDDLGDLSRDDADPDWAVRVRWAPRRDPEAGDVIENSQDSEGRAS